ncbi:MAG: flagellar basal body rod protein FlgC [Rhodothermales bacterium]|nr:flagellar basal body rod protein FlgC [Rhodothermales bacterium]
MDPGGRILSFFRTASRGLQAQRIALATATENIANAQTTRTADGQSYAIKRAVHRTDSSQYEHFGQMLSTAASTMNASDGRHLTGADGTRAMNRLELGPETEVIETERTRAEYDPSHPDADPAGYVHYPDINVVEEMARMVSANRLYEANLSSVQSAKEIIKRTLEI